MLRDVPSYRHLIEICHSGLEVETTFIGRLLAAHRESCEADGIRLEVVRRGVVPGQVMITVGGGAEAQGLCMVEWVESQGRPARLDVYIHPHSLPKPLFFLLPSETEEARRQLRMIIAAREVPTAALTALAASAATGSRLIRETPRLASETPHFGADTSRRARESPQFGGESLGRAE